MATITVIGVGPGKISWLTKEAEHELLLADRIFFRTAAHPVYTWLHDQGKRLISFDIPYRFKWSRPGEVYEFIASALLKEARLRGNAVYAVPGSPAFMEDTTRLLRLHGEEEQVEIRLVHGISFLEFALAEINFDFSLGLQIVLPLSHVQQGLYRSDISLLVCQIEAQVLPLDEPRVDLTMKWLLEKYPAGHPVTLIWTDGLPDYKTESKTIPLTDLAREYGEGRFFASLYVPPR